MPSPTSTRRFPWMGLAVVGVWVLAALLLGYLYLRAPAERLIVEAQQALDARQFARAKQLALTAAARDAAAPEALLIAGRAAAALQQFDEALGYWARIDNDRSPAAVEARTLAGDMWLMERGDIAAAEEQFRAALEQDPGNTVAHHRLAYLIALEQGGWAATTHRIALIRLRDFRWQDVHALALTADTVEQPERLQRYRAAAPTRCGVLTALARAAWTANDPQRARQLLAEAAAADPQHVGAQVELGHVKLDSEQSEPFVHWWNALTAGAFNHPDIWALGGQFARRQGETRTALRCFGEAVRRDPNHRLALYQLGQLLAVSGQPDKARVVLARAELLEHYVKTVEGTTPTVTPEYAKAAQLAVQLELFWEAYGFAFLALNQDPSNDWAPALIQRLQPRLERLGDIRFPPSVSRSLAIDLEKYPLPDWLPSPHESQQPARPAQGDLGPTATFAEQSAATGLAFRYFNGGDSIEDGMQQMYEFTGGGIAVLDYDGDGWPDLHFTQGCAWPASEDQQQHLDQLFRNLGNGQFAPVTLPAALRENGFSQGVAAGDYDNDGFTDLVVPNIGQNRLFHNQGDGTFAEINDPVLAGDKSWTTSCAIVDLSGDQLPDIYCVNYLSGGDLFTRICRNGAARVLCLPQWFPAAPDQWLLNSGDGTFRDESLAAGLDRRSGRGLGIVAAQLHGDSQLDLFIANDMDPNFLLVPHASGSGAATQLIDLALLHGLAANRNGQFEACMGIAAGDADGDGRMDLLVTNFDGETNTLYRQLEDGFFEDATERSGLGPPSFEMLGFGTQLLDADLDGDLDLIVANGQIDDVRPFGRQYQMPPQYFQNQGDGRFIQPRATLVGEYFGGRYLGRALARLDWNRDGREDVVISHLDAPAALLTNTTAIAGHFVAVRLSGVESARDAVGATLRLQVGQRQITRQLTAGDGYHASNQRLVVFGLGSDTAPSQLSITWPSGLTQIIDAPPIDTELWIVEGREAYSGGSVLVASSDPSSTDDSVARDGSCGGGVAPNRR